MLGRWEKALGPCKRRVLMVGGKVLTCSRFLEEMVARDGCRECGEKDFKGDVVAELRRRIIKGAIWKKHFET